ncbi:MAG: putative baseplate assembly protein [Chloroflexota bacterium]
MSAAAPTANSLNDCGCCAGITTETPVIVDNRPGLSAISYRAGTHSRFKDSMLAALSSADFPALKDLRTRANDDFTIALLDAVATVADVLTFYQERLATESFLRTATERRSILELARLIGYELHPGVAASAALAFTLDDAAGAPRETVIDIGTRVQSIPGPGEKPQTFETVEKIAARVEWNALKPKMTRAIIPKFGDQWLYLKGVATNLKPGDAILIVGQERENDLGSERWDFRRLTTATVDNDANRTRIEWAEGLGTTAPHTVLPAADPKVYALRQRAALFGGNAPHPKTLGDQTLGHYGFDVTKTLPDWTFSISNQIIDLDTTYPSIIKDSWLVLSKPTYQELYRVSSALEASRADFTLTGKMTRITLDTNENLDLFDQSDYRDTMVFAQSEFLEMAEVPIEDAITGAAIELEKIPSDLVDGQQLAVTGKDSVSGSAISEVVKISAIDGATVIVTPPLAKSYARASFSVNANVAAATHGETVQELLGGGDASEKFQTFKLRQPPLTYISATNASGAASTLEVRVNDLLWHETPTLYGQEAKDHVYIARRDDDGNTTVQFGDGVTGARLPSGQNNIRARYRKNIGLEGLVKAGQLSMLLSRPLGVKGVINPLDATGAQDPEQLDDARTNAPLKVLTLERVVSLIDYENFARAFGGIAKALATWTWDGRSRGVLVTVAGPNGAAVNPGSATFDNLLAAMRAAGDPFVELRVKTFRPAYFHFAGNLKIDADFESDRVLAAVEQALREQFAFAARAFGQPVMLSEVIAVIQAAPGVIAVDVDKLYRSGSTPSLQQRLLAELPVLSPDGQLPAAELLTLDAAPLDQLGVMA